jgi:mono/diheme cytochrome c family protein
MKQRQRRSGRSMPFGNTNSSSNGVGWKATIRAFLLLLILCAIAAGAVAYSIASRGLSAHAQPSRAETILARAMRRWATPQAARNRTNPVEPTRDVLDQALAHYADHCAICHGNDGSGDTEIGRALYPRVPDMRAATTQSLTDGELFSIIEHGVRLTGMPGWGNGTEESERESWALVHFVRRLPKLADEEIERMEALNPKTPAQLQEEEDARRFLSGDSSTPAMTHKERKD